MDIVESIPPDQIYTVFFLIANIPICTKFISNGSIQITNFFKKINFHTFRNNIAISHI